jgi:hypothetical protein
MEKHDLGPDPYYSSFTVRVSFTKTDVQIYVVDSRGGDVDSVIVSKYQALKLAELIKQKYGDK